MPTGSVFHDGELTLQRLAGVAEKAAISGRVGIRPFMPEQHRLFFAQLPFLIVGSIDKAGQPTASILTGAPGFVGSPDEVTLTIAARAGADDPLAGNLREGAQIGILGIEPHTRRRNRANGHVGNLGPDGFTLRIEESFGNCPQYIQARDVTGIDAAGAPAPISEGALLSPRAHDIISRSDTFFIASAANREGRVDVSHRGGLPGFVYIGRADGASELLIPDYRGNNFFNTLGNILSHKLAGLLFIDFASGDLLQLNVEADVITDEAALAAIQGFERLGAARLLRCRIKDGLLRPAALPFRWSAPELAAQLARTGTWRD